MSKLQVSVTMHGQAIVYDTSLQLKVDVDYEDGEHGSEEVMNVLYDLTDTLIAKVLIDKGWTPPKDMVIKETKQKDVLIFPESDTIN